MNYKEFNKALDHCPFCDLPKKEIIEENDSAAVLLSRSPYVKDHLLVVPKKHVVNLSELDSGERDDLFRLVFFAQDKIEKIYGNFSTLYREGEKVGKSIAHAHFNIVPKLVLGVIDEDLRDRYVYTDEEYAGKIDEFRKIDC